MNIGDETLYYGSLVMMDDGGGVIGYVFMI